MPLDNEKIKVDLDKRLKKYSMQWGAPFGPPSDWRQGAPLGNGDFGAMVYGAPDNFSLALGKTDLGVVKKQVQLYLLTFELVIMI